MGAMFSFTSHQNTFQKLPSTFGVGYFFKQHFAQTHLKKIPVQWFGEWRHLRTNGYYVRIADWHMAKISTTAHTMALQFGADLGWCKSFSTSLSTGIGAIQFLKAPDNPQAGKHFAFRPHGTFTLQYHLKL